MDKYQDIKDKDGNIIGQVKLFHWEVTYGDGRGNRWTEEHDDLTQADFSGMNLENADFRGLNLCMADFRKANLKGADFRGADVVWAVFYDAVVDGADFRGVNLRQACMTWQQKKAIITDNNTLLYYHDYSPSFM